MRATLFVKTEENCHRVGALLILADILEIECLSLPGLLGASLISIGDQGLPLLRIGEIGEESDDRVELRRIGHRAGNQTDFSIGAPTRLPHSVQEPS